MSNAQGFGSAQDLNAGRSEALRGLLSSLNQSDNQSRSNLPQDEAKLLTETLEQMLQDVNSNGESAATMNERGELLNNEGLPIIEITEPVEEISSQDKETTVSNEPHFVPLNELSPTQRDQLRKRREHIFAVLEAEEEEQTKKDAKLETQKRRDELDRRRAAAKAELDRIRAANEMQRKMGRALVRSATTTERELGERRNAEEVAESSRTLSSSDSKEPIKERKVVSFTDATNGNGAESFKEAENKSSEFGDVSIAPIANGRRRPINSSLLDKQPMKMEVVERIPGANSMRSPLAQRDSDDDSDSNTSSISQTDVDSSDVEAQNSNYYDDKESDDEEIFDDELDFSEAQHQREILLQYLELKNKFGSDIAKTMTDDASRDEWDQPEVPLEATLSSNPQKPRVSRFKSLRSGLVDSGSFSASPSTFTAANIIPVGQVNAVRHAVRMGKLENDQLVGDDYDDDGNEDAKRVTESLRKGQITTIDSPPVASPAVQSSLNSTISEKSMPILSEMQTSSESSTPLMTSKRSSPKLTPPSEGPHNVKSIANSYFQRTPTTIKSRVAMNTFKNAVQPAESSIYTDAMVVESPSYPFSSTPTQPEHKPRNDAVSVMSANVLESRQPTSVPKLDGTRNNDKKISRFKADRL